MKPVKHIHIVHFEFTPAEYMDLEVIAVKLGVTDTTIFNSLENKPRHEHSVRRLQFYYIQLVKAADTLGRGYSEHDGLTLERHQSGFRITVIDNFSNETVSYLIRKSLVN